MQIHFAHFGISVPDLDKSVQWYRDIFGFEEKKRFEKPELEIKGALLQNGNAILEILQPYKPEFPSPAAASLIESLRLVGTNHFAITVEDAKAVFESCKSRGVEIVTPLMDSRFFFCRDPDKTLWEIRGN